VGSTIEKISQFPKPHSFKKTTLGYTQSTHWKTSLQIPLAETFATTLKLHRPLPQREIQCNPITNSLYLSSCSYVATFFFILAQNMPHLMGQSSTTCTLVAHLMDLIYYKYVQWDGVPMAKGGKVTWDELPRLARKDTVSLKKCVGAPETCFILTLSIVMLAWGYNILYSIDWGYPYNTLVVKKREILCPSRCGIFTVSPM
jgi:hypothetical protein